ncbi:uncharacterized protein PSFLO_06568 [Pseudozyma flocculosa]|uniref:Uracil-DNA glycosylase-like domain-containing protein n=1 Tax=Pseudozyma flocculosa TaxID=84751 RepID=A0A5C3FAE5_9BASI|nr:uncharacterized protein PSFLO_06568 [Pseudozyma flocculosa]
MDSPDTPPPRLPAHFAHSYAYTLPASPSPSPSPSARAPRRSPRKPVPTVPYASLVAPSSSPEPHARSSAASTSRTRSHSADPSASASPSKKRKRIKRTVDDPASAEGSKYAQYHGVPDHISPRNHVLLCGINPGLTSSALQHHFAGPTNHFYPVLHQSGLTSRRFRPDEDHTFPTLRPFSLGLTNIGQRPTVEASELPRHEMDAGVPVFLRKVDRWRPRTVAFVGKGIAEVVSKCLKRCARGSRTKSTRNKGETPPKRKSVKKDDVKDDSGYGLLPFVFVHRRQGASSNTDTVVADPSRPLVDIANIKVESNATSGDAIKVEEGRSSRDPCAAVLNRDTTSLPAQPSSTTDTDVAGEGDVYDDLTFFFVSPSTSARVTTHFLNDKAQILRHLARFLEFLSRRHRRRAGASASDDIKVEPDVEDDETRRVEFRCIDLDTLTFLEARSVPLLPAATTAKVEEKREEEEDVDVDELIDDDDDDDDNGGIASPS